jgi:predicted Rossmann-fold nucleotide-binding protein
MGALGRRVDELGGQVHGVKPEPFLKYEIDGLLPDFGYNELVDDLHTQKRRMASLADVWVILPGGFGTLEELVTVRMWSKLGKQIFKHSKRR